MQRLFHRLPKTMKDVWWHQAVWNDEKRFPIVNWDEIGYLHCQIGLVIPMKEISDGRYAYYKVVDRRYQYGDWIYDGDAYTIDLEFHSIRDGLGVGNLENVNKPTYVTMNP